MIDLVYLSAARLHCGDRRLNPLPPNDLCKKLRSQSFSKQPESVQNSQIPIISLVGATELERSVGDWQPGRYAWKLENVRPIAEPIPYRGKQGLTVIRDEAILQAIEVQLTKTAEIEQQLQAIGGGAL